MKQKYLWFIFVYILLFLSACTSETSVELVDTSVQIMRDEDNTSLIDMLDINLKKEAYIPTVLYYEFTLKNIGETNIDFNDKECLEITIQPHDSLIAISEEILGFNIYHADNYQGTDFGAGKSNVTYLEPGQEETFVVFFDMGISEKSSVVSLHTATEGELDQLTEHALEATLIIEIEEEEIARFDINP